VLSGQDIQTWTDRRDHMYYHATFADGNSVQSADNNDLVLVS